MANKKILFISALDFKEKSIQVIKNTPEAYVKSGWEVHYVVLRDSSKNGNYFYEDIINPEGVIVYRKELPLKFIKDKTGSGGLSRILRIISNYLGLLKLFFSSFKILKNNDFDVVYGYETLGFVCVKMLSIIGVLGKAKQIARFQGTTHFNKYLKNKSWIKILLNMHFAYYLSSDFCIMTNDGTRGNEVLKEINSGHFTNFNFWINGVDELLMSQKAIELLRKEKEISNEIVFLSISRLHKYKSVDRGILAVSEFVNKTGITNFKYFIIGEGQEKQNLINLAKNINLEKNIIFIGAVPHKEIKNYLNISDFFISLYDGSNVGNPLLEAIRTHKIIFTLNEDDTSSWIQHKKNGFIYDFDEDLYKNMSVDIDEIISGKISKDLILQEIKNTEKEKLWTWEERMKQEVKCVEALIN